MTEWFRYAGFDVLVSCKAVSPVEWIHFRLDALMVSFGSTSENY